MLDRISEAQPDSKPTALIPRSTIEEIVGFRNQALELYAEAFEAIAVADAKLKAAREVASKAAPGHSFYSGREREVEAFHNAVQLPDRAEYLRVARRLIDGNVWTWIVQYTELERLMDAEAKETLRNQMRYVPDQVDPHSRKLITGEEIEKGMPPVTVENIRATLEQFAMDSQTIFRRGVANAFSKLDRRFRSHDGFKIGSRVILTYAFDGYGGGLQYGAMRDTLIDIERAFAILDGDMTSSYSQAVWALDQDRKGSYGQKQSCTDTKYFRIRGYKNRNAHLWFTNDELVDKVNKLLAEYYGEVIGDGQTDEDSDLFRAKTTPAKYFGYYPTPDGAATLLVRDLPIWREPNKPRKRILEPSAGSGNLVRKLFWTEKEKRDRMSRPEEYRWDATVDCVEIQPHLATALRSDKRIAKVYHSDFLTLSPKATGLYDLIVMNPPFDRERDIDHVMHALDFLKPDGFLTAIMSAGTEFRESRKTTAFRALIERMHGRWDDLPPGSFSEVGTNINTIRLRVFKDAHSFYGY